MRVCGAGEVCQSVAAGGGRGGCEHEADDSGVGGTSRVEVDGGSGSGERGGGGGSDSRLCCREGELGSHVKSAGSGGGYAGNGERGGEVGGNAGGEGQRSGGGGSGGGKRGSGRGVAEHRARS